MRFAARVLKQDSDFRIRFAVLRTTLVAGLVWVGLAGAQDVGLEYATRIGTDGGEAAATAVALDGNDNIYLTGYFSGTIDFDPGPGRSEHTSAGDYDAYVCKLDPKGAFQWVKPFGGAFEERGHGIALDSSGNIYVAGRAERVSDDEPSGEDTTAKSGIGAEADKGYFPGEGWNILLYSLDGVGGLRWKNVLEPEGTRNGEAFGVAVGLSGRVYVTGHFQGTVDFDPGPNTETIRAGGSTSSFLGAYDRTGSLVWVRSTDSVSFDNVWGRDVALDPLGNLVVTGYFDDEVDLDPGPGESLFTSAGDTDFFIQKFTADGELVWGKSVGGAGSDWSNGIAVDGSGEIYTAGGFQAVVDFDPGPPLAEESSEGSSSIFILRLSSAGDYRWARVMGGTEDDFFYPSGYDVAIDTVGNVFATGSFGGAVDFDPGPGVYMLEGDGSPSMFAVKLDASGALRWAHSFGDFNASIDGAGVALAKSGRVHIAGTFGDYVDFDPGEGENSLTSTSEHSAFLNTVYSTGDYRYTAAIGQRYETHSVGDVVTDQRGNLFIAENISSPNDFEELVHDPLGSSRRFSGTVSKRNSSGELIWSYCLRGGGLEFVDQIDVDGMGNVYVSGVFTGTVDFDPGPGVYEMTSVEDFSHYIQKVDSNGSLHWARSYPGGRIEELFGLSPGFGRAIIAAGSTENLFVMGTVDGTFDFGIDGTTETISSIGANDVFVQKLDTDGRTVWIRTIGGEQSSATAKQLAIDSSDNVYTLGHFLGTVDFDPGTAMHELTSDDGTSGALRGADVFLQKMDYNGEFQWVRAWGWADSEGSTGAAIRDFDVDCTGNVYTTGSFIGTVDFDPGDGVAERTSAHDENANYQQSDFFLQKLDLAGEFAWVQTVGGNQTDYAHEITVDDFGSVYVAGAVRGTVDFDPREDIEVVLENVDDGLILEKFNPDGQFQWVQHLGSSLTINGPLQDFSDIKVIVDPVGNLYALAGFGGKIDVDPGEGVVELQSTGGSDIFVLKLSQADTPEGTRPCEEDRREGEEDDETTEDGIGNTPCEDGFIGESDRQEDNPSEIAQSLVDEFNTADTDNDGKLSFSEASTVWDSLSLMQFDAWDTDNDGLLNEAELVAQGAREPTPGNVELPQGCNLESAKRRLGDLLLVGLAIMLFPAADRVSIFTGRSS